MADENAKDNAVLQAQTWAQEARSQRETVLSILRYFGLPEHDWEALRLIREKVEGAAGVTTGDGAERRVEAVIEKLRRCKHGCGPFGQCKAAMHGKPGECAAASVKGTGGNDGNT